MQLVHNFVLLQSHDTPGASMLNCDVSMRSCMLISLQHRGSTSGIPVAQNVTKSHLINPTVQQYNLPNYKSHSPRHRTEDTYPPLFFRKLPGNRSVYAQMHNEKEQEMTSPVNHSEDTQHIIQGEEFIDDDLDSQTLGNARASPAFSSLIRTTTNRCY